MSSYDVKYPEIEVGLIGHDSNAMAIVGTVAQALKDNGVSKQEISEFRAEAYSGDYDNLLRTCMKWVNVA
jgi:hypothetical protein